MENFNRTDFLLPKTVKVMGVTCSMLLASSPLLYAEDASLKTPGLVVNVVSEGVDVKGVVSDEFGPVVGASVVVKGTTNGIMTGLEGDFILNGVKKGDIIVVSYVGYITQEITYTGQATLSILLKEDTQALDEVVVVGYGTTSKRKTTSAVSTVKADDLSKVPVPNVTQSLAGRAAGLIVRQSGGGVDSKASISIRGGGTPLYVIDNVICEERDFQNLNPEDIDQMSILKDASATAVYGARAANGIVMITTKRGKEGKLNVGYNFNYTLSQPAYLPKKVDSYNAALYVNRGLEYDGMPANYTQEDLDLFRNGTDPYGHPNTDWQDLTMRNFAPEQRHNLSVTGGSETMKIYSGLGYYNQESIYRTNSNNMQRYNLRTNVEADFKSIGLKILTGVEAYLYDYNSPASATGSGYGAVWSHIQNRKPYEPGYNLNGQIYSGTTDNPLKDISDEGGYIKSNYSSVRGFMNAEWALPWVQGLTLKAIGSYTIANDRSKAWYKDAPTYDWDGNIATPGKPSLSKNTYYHRNFNTQFLADYARTFNELHTIGATFGIEASGSDYDNTSVSRKDYLFDVDQIGAGPASTMENSSFEGVNERRAALIGRLKYDYMSKYMAEFNIRYDGSDWFPAGDRWGTFFSGSLAWAVSEEEFYKSLNLDKVFEQFKLRASYGEIGQDGGVNRYDYMASYNLNQRGAFLGGTWVPTFSEGDLVSPDITWYTTKDFDFGFDFVSLNSRLSGSVDYFAKVTTGYLASPSKVGYTAPLGKNLPKLKSNGESIRRGFDFVLQWKDNIGDFKYGVSANMTFYDDRWNINPNEAETDTKNPYKRNTQVGSYYGNLHKVLGYYTGYEDVLNSPKRNGSTNLMAGDLKYYDFNGDGKIDGEDQVRRGVAGSPTANYGINIDLEYKGWFMNMLWQGATNYNLYIDGILQGGNSNYLPVIYEFQRDIWAPDNTDALYPRQHNSPSFNGNNNFESSDYWLVNARYLRLKNLSVGYDFKHKLLKNVAWLSKCSLSLAGYNLWTISPAKEYGFDPESGVGNGYTYPISRVYTVSLNVGF
ncbi:SusC/RagA family TonB-linked outer membrane protein [Parabacteroides goldsteinii]|uniref:SusC/RagA family TonB-linked outer membrane protein n=1 Tax=Parabacteroides goldsteinii TaxID=328812 RepID=UPI003AB6D1BD